MKLFQISSGGFCNAQFYDFWGGRPHYIRITNVWRKGVLQITIQFHLDFDDLAAFQQNVIKHSYTHRIKKQYFKWISSIALLLAALFLLDTSFITVVASLIVVIIYYKVFPSLYNNIAFFKLSKQMQKKDYSHVLGACKMTVSDNGIDRVLADVTTHFDWEGFEKLREDPHHFFLYVNDLQGLIIPKKPDSMHEEETTAFHELIRRHADSFS
ncbi:YcxB family protein [Lentibacillus sp. N15]|uniref:YcxB family protein n=1 Tax=Lentibacillus songyuanensis TaxID=3136161 RepID=UPI0031BB14F3